MFYSRFESLIYFRCDNIKSDSKSLVQKRNPSLPKLSIFKEIDNKIMITPPKTRQNLISQGEKSILSKHDLDGNFKKELNNRESPLSLKYVETEKLIDSRKASPKFPNGDQNLDKIKGAKINSLVNPYCSNWGKKELRDRFHVDLEVGNNNRAHKFRMVKHQNHDNETPKLQNSEDKITGKDEIKEPLKIIDEIINVKTAYFKLNHQVIPSYHASFTSLQTLKKAYTKSNY